MTRQKLLGKDTAQALRSVALGYPETAEAIACAGTALESSAYKANKKTFLFVGKTDARLKLLASQAEAHKLAAAEPDRYRVGALGWVTVKLGDEGKPELTRLTRWIDESYQLIAGQPKAAPPARAAARSSGDAAAGREPTHRRCAPHR
jgi:hypothetical protein